MHFNDYKTTLPYEIYGKSIWKWLGALHENDLFAEKNEKLLCKKGDAYCVNKHKSS